MPSMTKRVNITTTIPVRTVTPPLSGTYKDIIMSTGDILKCISRRAIVDEILPNGTTVRLTMRNYYTDNGAGLDAAERAMGAKNEEKSAEEHKGTVLDTPVDDAENVLNTNAEESKEPEASEETATVDEGGEPDVPADEEQAPEAPATNVEEETDVEEAPVVETEETKESEASVEPAVEAEVAQANNEPPVEGEATEPKSTTKKTTNKKGSKKNSTKKPEAEPTPEAESAE